jgi:hypothetical protein
MTILRADTRSPNWIAWIPTPAERANDPILNVVIAHDRGTDYNDDRAASVELIRRIRRGRIARKRRRS